MGYADELAKMAKAKQQTKEEKKALEAKGRNAFFQVLPEIVELEALYILSDCSKAAKKGERSYMRKNPRPFFPKKNFSSEFDVPHEPLVGQFFYYKTRDPQVFKDASVYYDTHRDTCRKEFLDALVARLKIEGFRVKLSMLSDDPFATLLFAHERDAFLTVRW